MNHYGWHTPFRHLPDAQTLPHAPQLFGSDRKESGATHLPRQQTWPNPGPRSLSDAQQVMPAPFPQVLSFRQHRPPEFPAGARNLPPRPLYPGGQQLLKAFFGFVMRSGGQQTEDAPDGTVPDASPSRAQRLGALQQIHLSTPPVPELQQPPPFLVQQRPLFSSQQNLPFGQHVLPHASRPGAQSTHSPVRALAHRWPVPQHLWPHPAWPSRQQIPAGRTQFWSFGQQACSPHSLNPLEHRGQFWHDMKPRPSGAHVQPGSQQVADAGPAQHS